jgi:hypothetical protein
MGAFGHYEVGFRNGEWVAMVRNSIPLNLQNFELLNKDSIDVAFPSISSENSAPIYITFPLTGKEVIARLNRPYLARDNPDQYDEYNKMLKAISDARGNPPCLLLKHEDAILEDNRDSLGEDSVWSRLLAKPVEYFTGDIDTNRATSKREAVYLVSAQTGALGVFRRYFPKLTRRMRRYDDDTLLSNGLALSDIDGRADSRHRVQNIQFSKGRTALGRSNPRL